ncbi:MAG: helix-turn-helix transcriptional regulator [Bacilli bacterium]|nr:helix-turn-helix transcriptional regulator [Bacilli bacterium]
MNLGLRIKELRIEHDLTQEDLAEQLGVSIQAISRWENSITCPDISVLPILANMFDVTVDYLLDVDIKKKQQEINEIEAKYNKNCNVGKVEDNEKLLLEGLSKYPNNWVLKSSLLDTYFTYVCRYERDDPKYQEYIDKTIKLGNEILNKCVLDNKRYFAMQILVYTYRWTNELEKAKEIVKKLPSFYVTNDWLYPEVVTGFERIKAVERNINSIVELFYSALTSTYGRREVGLRAKELLKFKTFLDLVYEDGDYGFYHIRLFDLYFMCASDQAQIKNKDETLKYLNLAIYYGEIFDKIKDEGKVIKHTSFLVDCLENNPNSWTFSGDCVALKRAVDYLEKDKYDFLREDEEFKKIKEELINKLTNK